MTFPPPICMVCRHLNSEGMTCTAYTTKIPDAILRSEVDHRRPYKDDNGIQFEPNPAMPADLVESIIEGAVVN